VFLADQVFIICQKHILSNCFATLFTHSEPLTEVLIFSGNPVVVTALLLFTSLLKKNS